MPVVVVGAAAGAAAGAGGGAAAGAGASAAAGAGGTAGAAGGASAGAGTGTGAGASTGAGAGNFGKAGTVGMPGGNSGSALGTKLKSNFGANAGDGLKAGAKSVDGSVPGQNMSVSRNDVKAYDRYKDRAKDFKDNVDRVRNVKDTLFSEEENEEDVNYAPNAEELKKAGKSKSKAGKIGKLIALLVFLFVFLICAPAAVITAPISAAKGISETFLGSSEFSSLVPGGGVPGIGTVVSATKYFTLVYQLIDGMDDKIFLKTSMSKDLLKELVRLSASSYDNSIYQFDVKYLSEIEETWVTVGEEKVYGKPKVGKDGTVTREVLGVKPVMEKRTKYIYGTLPCSLDMKNYIAEYYVPWELSYAIAIASDYMGNGNLEAVPLDEDVFEKGLIYEITKALRADISYHTDYRQVYYTKLAEIYHGAGLTGLSVVVPISYTELRTKSHRVITDVEEGYLPQVVVVRVSSYLYDYDYTLYYKSDGGHYSELYAKTMNPKKLKKAVEDQGLSRSGKMYMLEILIGLGREDLAREVNDALELGYVFKEGK